MTECFCLYRASLFYLFFLFVPVFFIKSKHGWINEGIQGTAFFLGWATSASCSIYESADAAHLQQFILLRIGHVLIDSEEHFGSYTLLYAVEYLKRVGDRGFLYAHHVATLNDEGGLYGLRRLPLRGHSCRHRQQCCGSCKCGLPRATCLFLLILS